MSDEIEKPGFDNEIPAQPEPASLPPGNWRPLTVDLRINGKIIPVTVLALFESAPTFSVVEPA